VAPSLTLAEAARAIRDAHTRSAELVTVTITTGEHAGGRFISDKPDALQGSVDPEIDARALALANQVWETRTPTFADDLFAELHAVAAPLVIFGAGHIAVPLANLAQTLGFHVTVLDDRDEFAQPARFEEGVQVQKLDFTEPLAHVTVSDQTFVVLLTRAHKYDFDCLRTVLQLAVRPRYLGMIGSKRRVRAAFQALLAAGVPRASLAHVHAPVGVEIGAETPAEIAVSIAAELIQVRRNAAGTTMGSDARVLERMFPEAGAQ
jgi:xanthine/CO dehydrogenase XdhC/CoxF family maturation factor